MRANCLLTAAALLLAGCGAEPERVGNAADEAAAPPPSAPSPSVATAPPPASKPVMERSIPAAFHGDYDATLEACGRASDGRLTVSARELRFHESFGLVRGVVAEPDGAIRVEADYEGEGEAWRSRRELLLSEGGTKLTISGDGTRMVRVRCPGAA